MSAEHSHLDELMRHPLGKLHKAPEPTELKVPQGTCGPGFWSVVRMAMRSSTSDRHETAMAWTKVSSSFGTTRHPRAKERAAGGECFIPAGRLAPVRR